MEQKQQGYKKNQSVVITEFNLIEEEGRGGIFVERSPPNKENLLNLEGKGWR
jgi:hypothetical protein